MIRLISTTALLTAIASSALADSPPSQPGNFRASLYNKAGGELFWQRSTDDSGAVRGYEITKNGQSLGIRDALSFYDRSLQPGISYSFTVVAIDKNGQRSSMATTTLGGDTSNPPVVGNIPAAPDSIRADVYSKRSAELFWKRESSALALRYEIRQNGVVVDTTNGVSYYTRSLAAGTNYTFEVIAIGRDGRRSTPTSIVVRTDGNSPSIATPLAAPAGLRAEVYSQTAAELFWTRAVTPGLRYEVKRDGEVVGTTDGTSFYDNGLADSTRYRYEVVALNSGRRSSASGVEVRTGGFGQAATLEVRDSFTLSTRPEAIDALATVAQFFESSLPEERPYLVQMEAAVPFSTDPLVEGLTQSVLIDIDAAGTGTYSEVSRRQDIDTIRRESRIATRTSNGNSVEWSGTYSYSDSSSGLQESYTFTAEVSGIDERTRLQTGEFRKESSGNVSGGNRPINGSYDLKTGVVGDFAECDPLTGTISYDSVFAQRDGFDITFIDTMTIINKLEGDRYWTVRETNSDESTRDEYLIASLALGIFCKFPEF